MSVKLLFTSKAAFDSTQPERKVVLTHKDQKKMAAVLQRSGFKGSGYIHIAWNGNQARVFREGQSKLVEVNPGDAVEDHSCYARLEGKGGAE